MRVIAHVFLLLLLFTWGSNLAIAVDLRSSYPNAGPFPPAYINHLVNLGAYQLTSKVVQNEQVALGWITDNNNLQGYTYDGAVVIPENYQSLSGGISIFTNENVAKTAYQNGVNVMKQAFSGVAPTPLSYGDEGVKAVRNLGPVKYAMFNIRKGKINFVFTVTSAKNINEAVLARAVNGSAATSGNAELIALLHKLKPAQLYGVSDEAIDTSLAAHPGAAFRLGRLVEAIRRYDAFSEAPIPPRDAKGWVDMEKIWTFVNDKLNPLCSDPNDSLADSITKLIPELSTLVGYKKFFQTAHDTFKITRDAVLIPAIEEKAYQSYRNERNQGQNELNAYDFAIVKNSYSVRVDPNRIPILKQKLEVRYQYDKLISKREEMLLNRKANIGKIIFEYQNDIDTVASDAVEEETKKK